MCNSLNVIHIGLHDLPQYHLTIPNELASYHTPTLENRTSKKDVFSSPVSPRTASRI